MRDQRSMTGHKYLHHPPEIEAAWARYSQRAGWEGRNVLLRMPGPPLTAYVSAGRWVADCPACNGGIACWSENPKGACLSCGRIWLIRFPQHWQQAEALLDRRPYVRTQNWHPHLGETVEQLRAENLAHGIEEE